MNVIDLTKMTTETRNENSQNLDSMTVKEILQLMNQEDQLVALAVSKELTQIESAVVLISNSLKNEGRLIYVGAGTSGRLGVLDAVECPPTFGTSPETVVGLIAGGEKAFVRAKEGAEDDKALAIEDLKKISLNKKDTLVGIAASGRTPYVISALDYANSIGASSVSIACNKNAEVSSHANVAIEVSPGPEILTGSTRLKAGTAQKLILNMLSTTSMIQIGKVYKNLMVDVQQTNAKLVVRAQNIVMEATDCTRETAIDFLEKSQGSAKLAIIMILLGCDLETAKANIENAKGHVNIALKNK